jgi:hypothetical protein
LGKQLRRKSRLKKNSGSAGHRWIADACFPKPEALPHLLNRRNNRNNDEPGTAPWFTRCYSIHHNVLKKNYKYPE